MRYTVPFLLLLLVLIGCTKNAGNSNSQGTLSAVVASTNFNSSLTFGSYFSSLGTLDIISIVPQPKDSTIIRLTLPYPPPANLALSSDTSGFQLSYYTRSGSKSYDAFSGSGHAVFTLSRFDSTTHTLAGIFSGTLLNDFNPADSIVITNGKFTSSWSAE